MQRRTPTSGHGPPAPQIPGLDGIRALAIVLVICWHCAHSTRFPPGALGVFLPFAATGWAGVDLFFALSGFLITTLLLDEERATGRVDLGRFYARRALRIFPAFYLVLGLDLLLLRHVPRFASLAGAGGGGAAELTALISYWSNYYYVYARQAEPAPALALFWSLCVEEHFYLLWPAFLALARGARARLWVAAAVCAVLPALRFIASSRMEKAALQMLSHLRLDSLLWGCLAALLLARLSRRAARRLPLLLLGASLVLVAVLFATGHIGVRLTAVGASLGLTALAVFGTSLAAVVAAAPERPLARLLAAPPLRSVGRVSYGMYLIHFLVIDLVAPAVVTAFPRPSPAVFALLSGGVTAATFGAAFLLYRFYERPFLRLKERFTPLRQHPAAV